MIASQRDDGDYDVLTAISQDTLGADRAASIAKHAWGALAIWKDGLIIIEWDGTFQT